jgi:hypothetical protein
VINVLLWAACFVFCMLAGVLHVQIAEKTALWSFIYGSASCRSECPSTRLLAAGAVL